VLAIAKLIFSEKFLKAIRFLSSNDDSSSKMNEFSGSFGSFVSLSTVELIREREDFAANI